MQDDEMTGSYPAENDFTDLTSEQIEVRAIGDVALDRKAEFSSEGGDSEQAIEYAEKHALAADEAENADPTRH